MPKFIDSHPFGELTTDLLQKAQRAPRDQFGVTHDNILYNKQHDKIYCILDAPSEEAVRKHHEHVGLNCDFVEEVKSTRG